jgi:addiction module RelE/StbE family toxin
MSGRKLRYSRKFKKDIGKLDGATVDQAKRLITELQEGNPSPGRDDKLRKPKRRGVRQARINHQYRLTYRYENETVLLLRVATHREIERSDC